MRETSFDADATWSEGVSAVADVGAILMAEIAGCLGVQKAAPREDRSGTDWWARLSSGAWCSIDIKRRRDDFGFRRRDGKVIPRTDRRAADDLVLETWSVVNVAIGWTRDPAKRTDFVLWYWEPTRRWCLVPFRPLCRVFDAKWKQWAKQYGVTQQQTRRRDGSVYFSEHMLVPRAVVRESIDAALGLSAIRVADALGRPCGKAAAKK